MRLLYRLCLFIACIQFLPGLQAAERLTLLDTLPESDTSSSLRPVTEFANRLFFERKWGSAEAHLISVELKPNGATDVGNTSAEFGATFFLSALSNNSMKKGISLGQGLVFGSGGRKVYLWDGITETVNEILQIPHSDLVGPTALAGCYASISGDVLYLHGIYSRYPIKTDGTLNGTIDFASSIENHPYSSSDMSPRILGIIGNFCLLSGFPIGNNVSGNELCKTDGSLSGTKVVKDIVSGQESSSPRNGAPSGNIVYFCAATPEAGAELWRTNGYESGTKLVEDIVPGTGSSNPFCLGATDADVMIFSANGNEIWRSNGNAAGTYMVKDTLEGTTSRVFEYVGTHLGKVYVTTPNELWVSDGTVAGTEKIADAAGRNHYRYLRPIGDYLFVTNPSGQICATDGSALELISTNTSQGEFSDKYFYQCIGQSEHGTTFLRSDGTAEGTRQFTAPSPGSSPVLLGILDGQLVYSTAVAEPNAQKIWSFDLAEDSAAEEWWRIYE